MSEWESVAKEFELPNFKYKRDARVQRMADEIARLQAELSKHYDVPRLQVVEDELVKVKAELQLLVKDRDYHIVENARLARVNEVYKSALELISAGVRPDGTYNRSREACEQLANEALKSGGCGKET